MTDILRTELDIAIAAMKRPAAVWRESIDRQRQAQSFKSLNAGLSPVVAQSSPQDHTWVPDPQPPLPASEWSDQDSADQFERTAASPHVSDADQPDALALEEKTDKPMSWLRRLLRRGR